MKRIGIACFLFCIALYCFTVFPEAWAIDTGLKAVLPIDQARIQKFAGIRALNSPKGVTSLTSAVYDDFNNLVSKERVPVADAARKQRAALLAHPDVADVQELKGSNLFVRFKDNNELLMLMGKETLGGDGQVLLAQDTTTPFVVAPLAPQMGTLATTTVIQGATPFPMPSFWSASPYALVFDCLSDEFVKAPPLAYQVGGNIDDMRLEVNYKWKGAADLYAAAHLGDFGYGVIFMRGHGGVINGNDFCFLVEPWYAAYPQPSSYTGTIRVSAFRYSIGQTQYGYAITSAFAQAYWTKRSFAGTMFFLESCHGADPAGLPGLPTWVLNHGASAWLGWNDSVSFGCGDNGSILFFKEAFSTGRTLGESVQSVANTGCRPPDLVLYSQNPAMGQHRPYAWQKDQEASSTPIRDITYVSVFSQNNMLYFNFLYRFPGTSSPEGAQIFIDSNNDYTFEYLVKCHDTTYEVFRQSAPGVYDKRVIYSVPVKNQVGYDNSCLLGIPWNVLETAGTAQVYFYDEKARDRAPNAGSYTVKR
jgi:hypothetical protein